MLNVMERIAIKFLDYLAVEKGLSKNTLESYGRDIGKYAGFLENKGVNSFSAAGRTEMRELVESLKRSGLSSASVARTLAAVKGLHRFLLLEGLSKTDPTEALETPKQGLQLPKALTGAEVESILNAPPGDGPEALRDRAMLETMYAAGLRVSELVGLPSDGVNFEVGFLKVTGKGSKDRLIPLGQTASGCHPQIPGSFPPAATQTTGMRRPVCHPQGRWDDPAGVLEDSPEVR